jgi:hypothetical protein
VGFFKRGREEATPGPGWAAPLSEDQTTAFLAAVGDQLERRGLPHEVGEGTVRVERGGEWSEYGLSNLAQLCHAVGEREWPGAIGEHFDNLFAAADDEARVQELARDFERIRSLLKVRLYPGASLGGMDPAPPASWELAPGLTAAFVYDLPTTVRSASPTEVEAWGKNRDELLSAARDNVRSDAVEEKALAQGASAPIACVADHFFAASHAFLLGERLPPEARGSAIFSVPQRHALLYAPLVDLGIVESINRLIAIAGPMFEQGPGSISPGLYWWREGSVTLLPSQFDGSNIQFMPPDDFVQALNALPEPAQ